MTQFCSAIHEEPEPVSEVMVPATASRTSIMRGEVIYRRRMVT